MPKKIGIPIGSTNKISKDGKLLITNEKRYSLIVQLKRVKSARKRFRPVKASERDYRP